MYFNVTVNQCHVEFYSCSTTCSFGLIYKKVWYICIEVVTDYNNGTFFFRHRFTKDSVLNSAGDTNAFARGYVECVQFAFRQIQEAEPNADSVLESLFLDQVQSAQH